MSTLNVKSSSNLHRPITLDHLDLIYDKMKEKEISLLNFKDTFNSFLIRRIKNVKSELVSNVQIDGNILLIWFWYFDNSIKCFEVWGSI